MTVTAQQRHTHAHRCPICDGADGDPRGHGKRCSGFTSSHGEYVHCSREDLAGLLQQEKGGTFAHRMRGPCRCGTTHRVEFRTPFPEVVATYDYNDESGELLYQVVRLAPKSFRQRKPDGAGGWDWKVNGTRRVPYRLRELVQDDGERPVYIVEGEKDADTLAARGYLTTCNPGGAGKWHIVADIARTALQGRDVVVIADRDDVGRRHAEAVRASLAAVARTIRVVEAPPPHKDVTDLLTAGGTLDALGPVRSEQESEPESVEPTTPSAPSLVERARAIRTRGPLVRLPTGLSSLDASCRGGLPFGRLVVVGGAPGAGKTALVVWLALACCRAGVPVVMLAVDEGPDDILLRIALLEGLDVAKLEAVDQEEWVELERRVGDLPLTLLDGEDGWTIDSAAERASSLAKDGRAVLVVDSAQTAEAAGTADAESPRARIDAVIRSLKRAARSMRLLVFATSELSRGAYRSRNVADRINDLASFKESGSVEYQAQTGLVLRSVADGDGVVEVSIPKNRGGRRDAFHIEIDERTRVREVSGPDPAELEHGKERREEAKTKADANKVHRVILDHPGIGTRKLRTKSRLGPTALERALSVLEDEGRAENRPEAHGRREDPHWFATSSPPPSSVEAPS